MRTKVVPFGTRVAATVLKVEHLQGMPPVIACHGESTEPGKPPEGYIMLGGQHQVRPEELRTGDPVILEFCQGAAIRFGIPSDDSPGYPGHWRVLAREEPKPAPLTGRKLAEFTLPMGLYSGNRIGQGRHWRQAHRQRKDWELLVKVYGGKREPFTEPVRLVITRVMGERERHWDADNVGRGSGKQIIDSLVAQRWLVDDRPKYLAKVEYEQDASQRKSGPATRIEFFALS